MAADDHSTLRPYMGWKLLAQGMAAVALLALGLLPVYATIPAELWLATTSELDGESGIWWAFILLGGVVGGAALLRIRSIRHFGLARLAVDPLPARVGAEVVGRLPIAGLPPGHGVHGRILCEETYRKPGTRSGRRSNTLWEDRLKLERRPAAATPEYRFHATLPVTRG